MLTITLGQPDKAVQHQIKEQEEYRKVNKSLCSENVSYRSAYFPAPGLKVTGSFELNR